MKAIVYKGNKKAALDYGRPKPFLREDYMLVKTVAIALNPTDWKHIENDLPRVGSLMGVDYAGIVEEVGSKVTKSFKKGDRVCGFAHGGNFSNVEDGTFAEYIVVKGDLQMMIPENLTFEEAATLGCGLITVGQGLFEDIGLNLSPPSRRISEPETVFVYGGSTATGTLAIQFLTLAGYNVITTCSPGNFSLVKSLGATEVFDYTDPRCGRMIHEYTQDNLKYAWDCIGTQSAVNICNEAMSSKGGAYGTILHVFKPERADISWRATLAYQAIGEPFQKGGEHYPANKEMFDYAVQWVSEAIHYIASGQIKVHPVALKKEGLKGALQGMEEMRKGLHSAVKYVYRVEETP